MNINTPPKTFLLVDGHAVLYRAFHAFPDLTDPSGRQVNAVYGFARLLLRSILDFKPEYVAIAFDHHGPTFRHKRFAQYKAHREEMPETLRGQVDIVKELVDVLHMPRYELAGYEADDLVGTAAAKAEQHIDDQTISIDRNIIVTGDSDLLQLVTDTTHVFLPKRGRYGADTLYTPSDVVKKYGVSPDKIPELKALTGDSSDNIPGVPGVGPKTARKIFKHVQTIQELYLQLDAITGTNGDGENFSQSNQADKYSQLKKSLSPRLIQNILNNRENAQMSLELATIHVNAPFDFDLEASRLRSYDKQAAIAFFENLAFSSLITLLPEDEFEAGIQSALF